MTLLGFDVSRRHLLICGFSLSALAVVAASPQLLGHQVAAGFDGLDSATPVWLWTGALAFVAALTSAGWAWRSALGCCGARICHGDAAARYAVGSLRSEEHTSELQSLTNLVCRLLLEKKKTARISPGAR